MNSVNYYEVVLKGVPKPLSYQSQKELSLGSLVLVPLGKKKTTGLILRSCEKPSFECSEILDCKIDQALTPVQMELCQWISSYYKSSLQRCLQMMVPSIIWNQQRSPKHEELIKLRVSKDEAREACKRSEKQQALIDQLSEENAIKRSQITNADTPILKALLKKELISIEEGELLNPDDSHRSKPHHDQALTEEQAQALQEIKKGWQQEKTQQHFLLHGVTGSGKTEIYLQLFQESIDKGKQCLLLVPEIALTTELIQYFSEHFPEQISILHSNLSEGERLQSWHRIHSGASKLIIGSRSALFSPWQDLECIIIDEEHEWTYKQDSSPRYHAKKVSEKIIELLSTQGQNPLLLLGSATPSIESYYQATNTTVQETHLKNLKNPKNHKNPHYHLLELQHRATSLPRPPVEVVDLRDEFKKRNPHMFSEKLQEEISAALERKEQVVLFLNKRGSASSISCRDCGYQAMCQHCSVSLTYHQYIREFKGSGLICHYCGSFEDIPQSCPDCASQAIKQFGVGTQKAVEQLQELFPSARILRADKDSTSGKEDFEKIYYQMKEGKADILLGTQMISKGLDLPNVTLTGILLADIGLHFPDFRASERVFQLLTQVAGRSGRHKPGKVVIQSYQPHHPAIIATQRYDYKGFYQAEITQRQLLNYPPFSESIKLSFKDPDPKNAAEAAQEIYSLLQDKLQERQQRSISNPKNPDTPQNPENPFPSIDLSPHFIPRLHGKFIWNIHLKGDQLEDLLKGLYLPKGWIIDRDPL